MSSYLCVQRQNAVPQGWLSPAEGEPKHQRMTGRHEGTSLRKSSSYFCQSIKRISKSVQVACAPRRNTTRSSLCSLFLQLQLSHEQLKSGTSTPAFQCRKGWRKCRCPERHHKYWSQCSFHFISHGAHNGSPGRGKGRTNFNHTAILKCKPCGILFQLLLLIHANFSLLKKKKEVFLDSQTSELPERYIHTTWISCV